MSKVAVAGTGMTRFGKFPDATVRTLATAAVAEALADAGLTPRDVDAVFFANACSGLLTGQENIRGQAALRRTGLLGVPIFNIENACASSSSAFSLAVASVAGGSADVALAVGSEKLTHPDRRKMFGAFNGAVDLEEVLDRDAADSSGSGRSDDSQRGTLFMDIYAQKTRQYMQASGATAHDFAVVAAKSHDHAALNEKAQYRRRVSAAEVLESRLVSSPLTLLMCSPIGDGAAAVVVCSAERARALPAPRVDVLSSVVVSGRDRVSGEPTAVQRASARAYEQAGVGPDELDVLEVHDAAAPAELMAYEELGLCEPGEGPDLLRSGATALGGGKVVNPSGGLLSKGHPVGATGCAQLVELIDQLRGRGGDRQVPHARLALAENSGGSLSGEPAATVITILGV